MTGSPTAGPRTPAGSPRFLARIPAWVWIAGLAAALLHMAPYWRADAQTPDGWTFVGNLSGSPDYMQYRVWMRQTQDEGILISNRFTTEPNPRHLPVLLYWGIGKASAWTGTTPEWVYAYLGGLLAVLFAVLLYATVRHFVGPGRPAAWTFGVLMLGGGLGGYLKYMEDWSWMRSKYILSSLFLEPLMGPGRAVPFENYRGNYIFQALFDTHFLVYWLVTTAIVMALYFTFRQYSAARAAGTAALFAFGTFLHVYEGVTLLAIAYGAALMCMARGEPRRPILVTMAACTAAVGIVFVAIAVIYKSTGLHPPTWRGLNVMFPVLLIAYPLAWPLLVWGIGRYWREGGMESAFLVGWALGCTALVLAGPFFPYPDRGTMTLQIPLYLMAGAIWFGRRPRVGIAGTVAVVLLLGSTPFWIMDGWRARTRFDPEQNQKWVSAAHTGVIDSLRERVRPGDVLLATEAPLRWLAPEYPGRHYAGHFFLTVSYEAKQARMIEFFAEQDPEAQAEFLRREGVRFVWVEGRESPDRFRLVPGLSLVRSESFGALFEFSPDGRS